MHTSTKITRHTAVAAAVSLALGTAMTPQPAAATEFTFNWTGFFTMLDSAGAPLANSSTPTPTAKNPSNLQQTAISGTLTYDDVLNTGSMTIDDFDFFSGSAPAQARDAVLTAIGDGVGGPGSLVLANMVFNWNGSNGIPVSVVFDASGLLTYLAGTPTVGDTITTASGAVPASDGIYVGEAPGRTGLGNGPGGDPGYLALGPIPVASTAWNTTPTGACTLGTDSNFTNNVGGGCMNVNPSGALPLIEDTANPAGLPDYSANDGGDIGGHPMADGPFQGSNATFDMVNMTLVSDGTGPTFDTPNNIDTTLPETATPTTTTINIGTVDTESDPVNDTLEFSIAPGVAADGDTLVFGTWQADSGTINNIVFDLTETVNKFTVRWRNTDQFSDFTLSSPNQTVTITITDTTAPAFTSLPADVTVSVDSTAEFVTFEGAGTGPGAIAATDATDPNPLIEWSLNNLDRTVDGGIENINSFGPGANTVYWTVTDATGNVSTFQQTVTLILPAGIVGQPCIVDPDLLTTDVLRQLEGSFSMRDSNGNPVGNFDSTVTGSINTSVNCDNESCTDSGAALETKQPFFGSLWSTSGIRLFDKEGTYTFETCLNDGSSTCTSPSPLTMTVGPNQIGAHMLFDWSVNVNIDVAVVWDFGCGSAQLVSSDPDGDGIIGTSMVDGPFKGMNASFDVSAAAGQPGITSGGYTITVPSVKNSVANSSPLTIAPGTVGTALGGVTITEDELMNTFNASQDDAVLESCTGGCFDFVVGGLNPGDTIQVVLPLSEPIPFYSLYRKYDAASDSWKAFVINDTDSVATALLNDDGSCPEPGSGNYQTFSSGILEDMLKPQDQCVQLTISDNGPNDDDPADGVIADPSGVGVTTNPTTPVAATSGGGCTVSTEASKGAGRLDLWLLAGLLGFLGLRRNRSRA